LHFVSLRTPLGKPLLQTHSAPLQGPLAFLISSLPRVRRERIEIPAFAGFPLFRTGRRVNIDSSAFAFRGAGASRGSSDFLTQILSRWRMHGANV
jgi:hypothetical protein